ncbi:hypothetical protein U1Q18_031177 [Sarracenia purpurea var. burkii]
MRFVKELVKLTRPEDLALQNKVGNTAPYFAAASGTTKIAEVMRHPETATTRGGKGDTIAKRPYPSCGTGEVMVALSSVTGGLINGEINQDSISTVVHCC